MPFVEVKATLLPGVLILKPQRFPDERGHFVETFNARDFRRAGIVASFVQDNQSYSRARGTIRGLHFQLPPAPQAKLVRVVRGSICDVVVDLRAGSPTYGRWIAQQLTAEGGEQVFVPCGMAHGFCTLEPDTEVVYKVDEYYVPEHDSGVIWNDRTLAIDWPVPAEEAVLSDKDRELGRFSEFVSPFRYGGANG
jgi:dTDP-4-dehydrorhamnose 3,5-epimerase